MAARLKAWTDCAGKVHRAERCGCVLCDAARAWDGRGPHNRTRPGVCVEWFLRRRAAERCGGMRQGEDRREGDVIASWRPSGERRRCFAPFRVILRCATTPCGLADVFPQPLVRAVSYDQIPLIPG